MRADLTELKEKQISHIRHEDEAIVFDFEYEKKTYQDIKLSNIAEVQTLNAGVAMMLTLDEGIDERAIRAGLLLPVTGRTEILDDRIILDVAHNEDAFKRLKETVKAHFSKQKIYMMFAAQKTKDIQKLRVSSTVLWIRFIWWRWTMTGSICQKISAASLKTRTMSAERAVRWPIRFDMSISEPRTAFWWCAARLC